MYQVLDNPRVMPTEEINKTFDGKWVYVVNANITPHGELIEGVPVVIGDGHFEGVEEGIYEQYNAPEYGRKLSLSWLLPSYDDLNFICAEVAV
ncbi:MAG: hypothetical protein FWB88_07955 [Defluviitaleaceae bacterium]|nr:hypothetical protein [Defluviitaleaceae bacterium]MCL2240456.1 hypothetical protein [Defluviitaleaceae bacterium]